MEEIMPRKSIIVHNINWNNKEHLHNIWEVLVAGEIERKKRRGELKWIKIMYNWC